MAFGAVGLIGNAAGRPPGRPRPAGGDRPVLGADGRRPGVRDSSDAVAWLAGGRPYGLGRAQAALFIVCHVRLMKSAPRAPAFAASLNISGANIGIGLGAVVDGHVIDHYGLAALGWAAAGIVALSVGLAFALMAASAPTMRRARLPAPTSCDGPGGTRKCNGLSYFPVQ